MYFVFSYDGICCMYGICMEMKVEETEYDLDLHRYYYPQSSKLYLQEYVLNFWKPKLKPPDLDPEAVESIKVLY